jgi:hypothetical protein
MACESMHNHITRQACMTMTHLSGGLAFGREQPRRREVAEAAQHGPPLRDLVPEVVEVATGGLRAQRLSLHRERLQPLQLVPRERR